MGMFVLKSMVNVGRPFSIVSVFCFVRWDFAKGRGMVNFWLGGQQKCKLTCSPLPECWTGIEKEIVSVQMLATRRLLSLPPCLPVAVET